jgi:hypothetical protein
MLKVFIAVFIFSLILFFYTHIQFHLKTSNDLEIYEIEQPSKDKLEEICDIRQPVLFDCDEDGKKIIENTNKDILLENYPVFEIKIRESSEPQKDSELYVPLPLHVGNKLFSEDKTSGYFSEGNTDFLKETGSIKNMNYNDSFLRPYLVSNCDYDIMMGSSGVETPLRYEINYRNYFVVTKGSIKIKLTPPKSGKYLYPINDYENLEFRSPINTWKVQSKYKADYDKIKFLEIDLYPGKFLFIPSYWWYSFKFSEDTSVSCFRYRTYMNNIAIIPEIFMYALQNQNVERKVAKTLDISFLNKKDQDNKINNLSETNEYEKQQEEKQDSLLLEPASFSIGETIIDNSSIPMINERPEIPTSM